MVSFNGLGFVDIVVIQSVAHAGGQRADHESLRYDAELHQEHAGAHAAAVLERVHPVSHGGRQARQAWKTK